MTIRGYQTIGHHKAGAGDANPQRRRQSGKTHPVDPKNVANGVAVAFQNHGRHGLFLLQLLHLQGKLLDLLL